MPGILSLTMSLNHRHWISNADRFEVAESLENVRREIRQMEEKHDGDVECFRGLKRYGICITR